MKVADLYGMVYMSKRSLFHELIFDHALDADDDVFFILHAERDPIYPLEEANTGRHCTSDPLKLMIDLDDAVITSIVTFCEIQISRT